MLCSEEVDAGQNAGPHAYKNTSYRTADLTRTRDTAIRGREKERFFKAHFSMSDNNTPFPTWR
ncbi:MAG: hypothetical protein K8R25_15415 [Methanosarcinales archaeon]|nr:hypothetical protein [Methanosarcinales archaeon]